MKLFPEEASILISTVWYKYCQEMDCDRKGKMLSELVKFSSQHRTIYCFLIMSVWIFLIIAGMYKYIIMEEVGNLQRQPILKRDASKGDSRFKKLVKRYCNPSEGITVGAEGIADESWALQGVMMVIRHGDRGPLTHVRSIDGADCNVAQPSLLLQRYQDYVNNMTAMGKAPWSQSPGPFHNLPLLPSSPLSECRLGQLTPHGLLQLLKIGNILGQIYTPRLGWDFFGNKSVIEDQQIATTKTPGNSKAKYIEMVRNAKNMQSKTANDGVNIVIGDKPIDGDIVVHSTRYRRAFQSALAFMWSVLGSVGPTTLSTCVANESPSLTFCAEDCACPAAEHYARKVSQESKKHLESHPGVVELIAKLSNIVFQSPSQVAKDPHILGDALMAYICHSAPLPCAEKLQDETGKINSEKNEKGVHIPHISKGFETLLQPERTLDKRLYKDNVKWPSRALKYIDSLKKKSVLDFDSQMEKEKIDYYQQKLMENADMNYEDVVLIKRNMDGDFNFNGDGINNPDIGDGDSEDYDNKDQKPSIKNVEAGELVCVKRDQLFNLFSYTEWELNLVINSDNFNKASLLRAYGLLHQIVKYILKMVSKGQPKFVLFSGHDKTLQYLSIALGLSNDNILNMHYASRLAIEIYKNEDKGYLRNRKNKVNYKAKIVAPLDFFLRVILNGKDVTRQVTFCRGNRSILADNLMKPQDSGTKEKAYLCRIENIIRFAHEDYFSVFNATNFKDSCNIH